MLFNSCRFFRERERARKLIMKKFLLSARIFIMLHFQGSFCGIFSVRDFSQLSKIAAVSVEALLAI